MPTAYTNTAQFPSAVWDGTSPSRLDASVKRGGGDIEDWEQIVAEVIAAQTKILADETENDYLRFITIPNADGGTIIPGQAVYAKADGSGCAKADCNGTAPLPNVIGLNTASCASLATATIQKAGLLTLTTAEWDAAGDTTGGLTPNKEYYLSATAGKIAGTVPATTGDHVVSLGIAVSSTVLNMNITYRRVSA